MQIEYSPDSRRRRASAEWRQSAAGTTKRGVEVRLLRRSFASVRSVLLPAAAIPPRRSEQFPVVLQEAHNVLRRQFAATLEIFVREALHYRRGIGSTHRNFSSAASARTRSCRVQCRARSTSIVPRGAPCRATAYPPTRAKRTPASSSARQIFSTKVTLAV